jgi:hypothetical protein
MLTGKDGTISNLNIIPDRGIRMLYIFGTDLQDTVCSTLTPYTAASVLENCGIRNLKDRHLSESPLDFR